MKLIIGLGNHGKKYEETRHNLGFVVLDALLQKLAPVKKSVWKKNSKSNCLITKIDNLILAKPQTMMNASGYAVKKLTTQYLLPTNNLWVVHDDLDLPMGKIKIKKGGGSAGHRGIESIVKKLGTGDFVRFRLGIGRPRKDTKMLGYKDIKDVEAYVLSSFKPNEKNEARKMVKQAVEAVKLALEEGLEKAMNRLNP